MKKYSLIIIFLFSSLFSFTSAAKTINLYETSKDNSKIIGTVDSDVGIIPIFAPKQSGWVKVADPRDGNVGWAKSSDLNDAKLNVTIIRTSNTKTSETNQRISAPTSENFQKVMQQMYEQQKSAQNQMEKTMKDMQENMQKLYG